MSKFSNSVEYSLKTTLDSTGLNKLQAEIAQVTEQLTKLSSQSMISPSQARQAISQIQTVQKALSSSFDSATGLINVGELQRGLSGLSVSELRDSFRAAGTAGDQAFNSFLGQIGKMDTGMKSVSSTADKIFNTFGNTVRWGVTASIFQRMQNSLYSSVEYIRELDTSLNNIRIVSGRSAEQMREFSLYANDAAQSLGQTTTAFTDASLIYLQQGLDLDTSNELADLTLRMASVTQQDTATASEQITSIMNGYNMTVEETANAIDVLANVAAQGASDMEELATAESRVASTAATLGVSQEQLAAQISTIISVTRQAPESVGTSLRTLYSRFADLKMGDTLEDGVDLGRFSKAISDVGVQVLDAEGNLRSMGDIIEDLMVKWQDLSSAQQISLGTTLAGRYQLNQFITLMNNMDMYNEQLAIASDSAGTLDEQQSIYMDSLNAKINQLTTAGEGLVSTLFNPDDFKPFIEMLTSAIDLLTSMTKSVGGLEGVLTLLGSTATRVFSQQLGQSLARIVGNQSRSSMSQANTRQILDFVGGQDLSETGATGTLISQMRGYQDSMTMEQRQAYNNALDSTIELENTVLHLKEQESQAAAAMTQAQIEYNNALTHGKKISVDGNPIQGSVNDRGTERSRIERGLGKNRLRLDSLNAASGLITEYIDNEETQDADALVKQLSDTLSGGREVVGIYSNEWNSLEKALNKFATSSGPDAEQQLARIQARISSMISPTQQEIDAAENLLEQNTARQEAGTRTQVAENNLDLQNRANQNLRDDMQAQLDYQNIINVTGAIGQLAFSWQAFQSLGSIWANTDLTAGEKFEQTLQNLIFMLPSIISGFYELKIAAKSDSFTNVTKSLEDYVQTMSRNVVTSTVIGANTVKSFSISAGAATLAAKAGANALTLFGQAANFLASPVGMAISVIGMLASAFLSFREQEQESIAAGIRDAADIAASNLESVESAQANFESLYQQYQNGAATSEELRSAAEELNSVLDDQTAAAYAAAGQWDAYAAAVQNAQQQSAQEGLNASIAGLRQAEKDLNAQSAFGFNENVENIPIGVDSVYYQDAISSLNDAFSQITTLGQYWDGSFAVKAGSSGLDVVRDLETAAEAYSEAIEQTTAEMNQAALQSGETSAEYIQLQNQLRSLQTSQESLQNIRSDYQSYIDEYEQRQQEAINMFITANQGEENVAYQAGQTIEQYKEQVRPILEAAGFTVTEDLMDDFVNGMASGTSENAKALATQLGIETARETFLTNAEASYSGTISANNIDTSSLGVADAGQYSQYAAQNLLDQITNSGLTENEQIEFIAGIDWTKSIEEIQQDVDNINVSGELPKLSFEPTLTDRSTFSDEQISTLLEDTGMSEGGFNRMTQSIFESDEIQEQADAIEEQIKELEDSGDTSEETADKIADLRQEYEDLGETSQDISAYNLQMNKGLSNLADNWEDLGDILKNDAAKGTSDYYEALGELDDIMSDVLNIDTGVLSEGFYQNADALDAMERAANGDVSAIDDLRQMAAQDIIMNLDVQSITPEDKSYLINNELLPMLNEFQALLDGQPLGTTVDVDTNPFIMKLNQLLANSQITAEQATNILSSIGMDANVGTKTQTTTQKYTAYFPKFKVEKDADGVMTGLVPDGTTPIEYEATENVEIPYIEGATYTGSGVQTVGYSSGGAGRKSSGSGGGGRKGSGSGKSYEPKTKDPVEDELDRYERVDTELDDISNNLDKLADAQERLLGEDLAKNMVKQIALLKEQVYWQKEKLKIQQQEAAEYRDTLASQYGVTFNDEGFITNYADRYKALLNNLNSLITQYNNTTTEEGQEALDKQIEAAQDNFDKFNDLVDNYDELISNSINESLQNIQSYYDQIEDLQIEAFQTSVEAVDNIKELRETLIDFNLVFSGMDSDSPFRGMANAAERLGNYWDVATEDVENYYKTLISNNEKALKSNNNLSEATRKWLEYQNQMLKQGLASYGNGSLEAGGTGYMDMELANLNAIMEQIRQFEQTGTSSIFGENEADLMEVAKDIFDSATDMVIEYENTLDDLKDEILNAIDEIGERLDDRIEQYENINDQLDHYASMIEMLHGDSAYDELNAALSGQVNNQMSQINILKQSIDVLKDMQSVMEEGSDEWKAVQEQITERQQDLLDMTEDTMDKLVEIYQNGVNKALDDWTADTPLGSDLDWVGDQWELINRNADYYLDDVNAAYNIQKLQAKYLELLDGSNDLAIQQQITDQMNQQLAYLREKDKLSQYDVEYANAQLEILQRQIALQEAQRNRSQLQLRRDTQGNYSYVYTADEGDVAGAQSDLLDAQNNAYNLSKDQIKQTQDDSLSALQDAKNMLNDLWNDANLTLEEKTQRTQVIIDSLKEYLAGTGEQLSTAEQNIINDFIGMCELLTDENRGNLEDVYNQIINGNNDAFDQIDTRWNTSLTEWLQNLGEFNVQTDEAFQQLVDNFNNYQSAIDDLGAQVDIDFGDITSSINEANDATAALNQTSQDFMTTIRDDAGIIKDYENRLAEMTNKIKDADNAMKAYQEQVNNLQGKLQVKEQENANLSNRVQELETQIKQAQDAANNAANGGGGSGGGSGGGASANYDTAYGIAQAIWTFGQRSGWGNDPIRSGKLIKAFGSDFAKQVQSIINQYAYSGRLVNYDSMKYSSYNLVGYDTGGYTGSWGKNGRLAMLHEKELVLNETDTQNILAAVDSVRKMSEIFRSGAFTDATGTLAAMADAMSGVKFGEQELEQNVKIEASFPNVSDSREIENALTNLVNRASQYVSRNTNQWATSNKF